MDPELERIRFWSVLRGQTRIQSNPQHCLGSIVPPDTQFFRDFPKVAACSPKNILTIL